MRCVKLARPGAIADAGSADYTKIRVSTRAAAALWAMQNDYVVG